MGKTESDQIEIPLPLLLDEVTSALNSDTEKRLMENLQHLTDRTVDIVTHLPAALGICDRVPRLFESGSA